MSNIPEHLLKGAKELEGKTVKGFWNPELGGFVHGIIHKKGSRIDSDKKERDYIIVQVLTNCACQDAQKNKVEVKTGEFLMMDYKPGMATKLEEIIDKKPTVIIAPDGDKPVPLPNSPKSMWRFKIHLLPSADIGDLPF